MMATVAEILFDGPRYSAMLRQDAAALRAASATVVRSRTAALKTALRKQVEGAGLGGKLAKAIRSQVITLQGAEGSIQGRVWSKALVKRPGGRADLITVFDEGATILARSGKWLAIPLPGAPRKGLRRARPDDYPQKWLVVKPAADRRSAVVCFKQEPEKPLWLLIRQVRIGKRLDVDRAFTETTQDLEARVARGFERAQRSPAPEAAA